MLGRRCAPEAQRPEASRPGLLQVTGPSIYTALTMTLILARPESAMAQNPQSGVV